MVKYINLRFNEEKVCLIANSMYEVAEHIRTTRESKVCDGVDDLLKEHEKLAREIAVQCGSALDPSFNGEE